jgi:hypothetical protein
MQAGTKQRKNDLVTKEEDQMHYYMTEVVTIKIMKDFYFMLCLRKHSQSKTKKKMGKKSRCINTDIIRLGVNFKRTALNYLK